MAGGQSCHDMNTRAVQSHCVFQSTFKALAELGLAFWQARNATFTGIPIPRRSVEQDLLQAVILQSLCNILGCKVVRKEVFNGFKAVFCCGSKAVQKIVLVVEHGEICGETRHGLFLNMGWVDQFKVEWLAALVGTCY